MTWQEALENIESIGFAAEANIASNLSTFIRIIGATEAIRTLEADPELSKKTHGLASRALELCLRSPDLRYRHRWDVALATYIWMLGIHNPQNARIMSQIVQRLPRCWWASQIADLTPHTVLTLDNLTAPYEPDSGDRSVVLSTSAQDSLLFPMGSIFLSGGVRLQFVHYGFQAQNLEDPGPYHFPGDSEWIINTKTDTITPAMTEAY